MKRDQRFPVVMSQQERDLLARLAHQERIPAAAVIRRLIWQEGQERGFLDNAPNVTQLQPEVSHASPQ